MPTRRRRRRTQNFMPRPWPAEMDCAPKIPQTPSFIVGQSSESIVWPVKQLVSIDSGITVSSFGPDAGGFLQIADVVDSAIEMSLADVSLSLDFPSALVGQVSGYILSLRRDNMATPTTESLVWQLKDDSTSIGPGPISHQVNGRLSADGILADGNTGLFLQLWLSAQAVPLFSSYPVNIGIKGSITMVYLG